LERRAAVSDVCIKESPNNLASTIQFDGQKFGIVSFIAKPAADLYRATFTRQNVRLSSAVGLLTGRHGKGFVFSPVSTWITNGSIVAPYGTSDSWIGSWNYPAGGRVRSSFNSRQNIRAVTISVPSGG
jgi:hypothetical protein